MNNRPCIYEDGTKEWYDKEMEEEPRRDDMNKPAVIYSTKEGCIFEYWDKTGFYLMKDYRLL